MVTTFSMKTTTPTQTIRMNLLTDSMNQSSILMMRERASEHTHIKREIDDLPTNLDEFSIVTGSIFSKYDFSFQEKCSNDDVFQQTWMTRLRILMREVCRNSYFE
jgi:hypothetical protein